MELTHLSVSGGLTLVDGHAAVHCALGDGRALRRTHQPRRKRKVSKRSVLRAGGDPGGGGTLFREVRYRGMEARLS